MRLLSNVSIRSKFLALPIIAGVSVLVLGTFFLHVHRTENLLLEQVADHDLRKIHELSRLFSALSTNHVSFISLLASSLREPTGKGKFYAQGRKRILAVNQIINDFERITQTYSLSPTQQRISDDLHSRLVEYRDQMGETVLMSSVDLKIIAQVTLRANEAYDAANSDFLHFMDAVQLDTSGTIDNVTSIVSANTTKSFIILGMTLLFIAAASALLATLFSRDLKATISVLTRLAQGDTSIPLTSSERKDEFGAVDRAIQIFREALIRRDEAEQYLKSEIAERERIARALRASEERFRTLYEDNPLMLITIDAKGTVLSINRRGARQIGFAADELVGSSVLDLVMAEDRDEALSMIKRCVNAPGTRHQWTLRKSHRDGNVIWLRETAQAIVNGRDPIMLLACEDITETHRLSEKLSYQATHDALTDLINRWEFERRLRRVLETAKEDHSEHVLIYMDLDQFKVINDTSGHTAGDGLLSELANRLHSHIRTRDTLARLGGDEFGMLLEHCAISDGRRAAETILKVVEDFRFAWKGREFRIGASIGVVQINELSEDAAAVLADADAACYTAKDEGRNRIHVYTHDDQELTRRRGEMRWATRIPQALEADRFKLFYQPIVPLPGNRDTAQHFELLVRLQDENGTWVLPGVFLPAAERYNLSAQIDRWVVANAFAGLKRLNPQFGQLGRCGINLSGHSLGNRDFLAFVLEQLKVSGIKPETVCFEITETAVISNMSSARQFIDQMKLEGVVFALDDFGTGLSSFAYLRDLSVDLLKIDGVFVKNIVNDPIELAMVRSINDIGHVMGMRTIAEFVETQETVELLTEIGVDYAQGYHLGRPRPTTDIFCVEKVAPP